MELMSVVKIKSHFLEMLYELFFYTKTTPVTVEIKISPGCKKEKRDKNYKQFIFITFQSSPL